jgi:hypothetical protein
MIERLAVVLFWCAQLIAAVPVYAAFDTFNDGNTSSGALFVAVAALISAAGFAVRYVLTGR